MKNLREAIEGQAWSFSTPFSNHLHSASAWGLVKQAVDDSIYPVKGM